MSTRLTRLTFSNAKGISSVSVFRPRFGRQIRQGQPVALAA